MKTRFYKFILLLLFSSPILLWGQCLPIGYEQLDGNQVDARYHNGGDMFWDLVSNPAYEVPKGSGNHSSFAGGLWIGGLDQSDGLHIAAATYRQTGNDFSPGPVRWTGQYGCETNLEPATGNILQVLSLVDDRIAFVSPTQIEITNSTRTSSQVIPFPFPRSFVSALQLNDGRIMVYGDGGFPNQLPVLLIDSSNFSVTIGDTLNFWQGRSTALQLPNGEVLIAGLFGTDLYDPVTGTSSVGASMGSSRVRTSMQLLPNGNIWIVGGSTTLNGFGSSTITEFYAPSTDTWLPGPNLLQGRRSPILLPLQNGNILVAGGNNQTREMELYDPVGNLVSSLLTNGPQFEVGVATERPNGNVFLANGFLSQDERALSEIDMSGPSIRTIPVSSTSGFGTVLPNGNLYLQSQIGTYTEFDLNTFRPVNQDYQKIWKINKSEIDQFKQDFLNGTVDFTQYPDIETWPGNGDQAKGEDQYLAPFIDEDLDGVYDPLNDGDYPCIDGDQALWWVFNDVASPHSETNGDPLGIQVEAMAFAYDCQSVPCTYTATETSTMLRYQITNKSGTDYKDVYFGFWHDVDLGNFADDFIGCDSTRGLCFVYNGDAFDENGYGNFPPASGASFLKTPDGSNKMTNFMTYENDFTVRGNPTTAHHYYNYLQSMWTDGSPLTVGGNGYGGNTPTKYFFPGDPGFCGDPSTGWSEPGESNTPFDRRYLMSFGPFDFAADSIVEFEILFTYNQGFTNAPLGSVCELFTANDSVTSWYNRNNSACFSTPTSVEKDLFPGSLKIWPNPAQSEVRIALTETNLEASPLRIFDQIGREVLRTTIPAGQQGLALELPPLPDGIYIVRIDQGNKAFTEKLVLQK